MEEQEVTKKKEKEKKCVNLRRIVFLSLVEKSRTNSRGSLAREILITDAVNFERVQPLLPCPEKWVKKKKNYKRTAKETNNESNGCLAMFLPGTNVFITNGNEEEKKKKQKERKKKRNNKTKTGC